jgi:HAMP domain-containing protein
VLVRRLAPIQLPRDASRRSVPDLLLYALGIVGAVFVVMYGVALALGLMLARSITRGVHALSVGTEKLREGDFSHVIALRSRDQLGELAASFNLMSRGIQQLMREQADKERLEEELRIARQIQMSLLPGEGLVSVPGIRIARSVFRPAEVGGDYYDLLPLGRRAWECWWPTSRAKARPLRSTWPSSRGSSSRCRASTTRRAGCSPRRTGS